MKLPVTRTDSVESAKLRTTLLKGMLLTGATFAPKTNGSAALLKPKTVKDCAKKKKNFLCLASAKDEQHSRR
jgi:hypothetical protein